jgi:hypothetical protein
MIKKIDDQNQKRGRRYATAARGSALVLVLVLVMGWA